jgi:L-aspartate oxidase
MGPVPPARRRRRNTNQIRYHILSEASKSNSERFVKYFAPKNYCSIFFAWSMIPTGMKSCELEKTDFLIIGNGVAAMRCAIALGPAGRITMLTKQCSLAQPSKHSNGLIAIASSDEEEIRLHYEDTLCAGEGLCDPNSVKVLIEDGPRVIEELISWGAAFERDQSKVLIPKDGAKPRPYTYRGRDQSTINEILGALRQRLAVFPSIQVIPNTTADDLIVKNGTVVGAHYQDLKTGRRHAVLAKAVFIGTGGMGQLYPETTNSELSTGDGLAIAYRAGAQLRDMEFIQFHPTVLLLKNAPRVLIPESLRAEGAYLRNADLQRFMHHYHQQEELAPRDVVSRAIMMEMTKTHTGFVYLDCTHLDPEHLKKRFSKLYESFLEFNIAISENMIPIHPAAHYCIGGIKIDVDGQTSLPGLFSAGEASCSGVHGSNRLPSNSLLESLVFGARAGRKMAEIAAHPIPGSVRPNGHVERPNATAKARSLTEEVISRLRKRMWQDVGVIRSGENLRQALQDVHQFETEAHSSEVLKHDLRLRNLLSVATVVTASALAREESRGAHYREDFPLRKDLRFLKHSIISRNSPVDFSE